MSMEYIVVLSVLGFGGLIGLFYMSHSMEKQKRQKALLITNLSEHVAQLERLYDSVPSGYMSKELQELLLQQIKTRLEKLVDIAGNNARFKKSLETTTATLEQLKNSTGQPPQKPLTSKEEVEKLRGALQRMSKVLESMVTQRVISGVEGKEHMLSLQKSYSNANINLMLNTAESARSQQKNKLALMNYKNALAEMRKRNQQHEYDEQIDNVEGLIEQLEQAPSSSPTGQADQDNELDQAVADLMEEDDAWKKKYF